MHVFIKYISFDILRKEKKSPKEKYGKIAGDKLEKIDISSPI